MRGEERTLCSIMCYQRVTSFAEIQVTYIRGRQAPFSPESESFSLNAEHVCNLQLWWLGFLRMRSCFQNHAQLLRFAGRAELAHWVMFWVQLWLISQRRQIVIVPPKEEVRGTGTGSWSWPSRWQCMVWGSRLSRCARSLLGHCHADRSVVLMADLGRWLPSQAIPSDPKPWLSVTLLHYWVWPRALSSGKAFLEFRGYLPGA